jgi:hypothetical protein
MIIDESLLNFNLYGGISYTSASITSFKSLEGVILRNHKMLCTYLYVPVIYVKMSQYIALYSLRIIK